MAPQAGAGYGKLCFPLLHGRFPCFLILDQPSTKTGVALEHVSFVEVSLLRACFAGKTLEDRAAVQVATHGVDSYL